MTKFAKFNEEGYPTAFYAEEVFGPSQLPVYGEKPEPTEDNPTPVAPIIGQEPNPAYAGMTSIPDAAWHEFLEYPGQRVWRDGGIVPVTPPPPAPVVPRVISDRQFFTQLALDGVITEAEAEATSDGTMPALLTGILDAIPDPTERFKARMLAKNATQFERDQPLVAVVAAALKWDNDRLDKLWTEAFQL